MQSRDKLSSVPIRKDTWKKFNPIVMLDLITSICTKSGVNKRVCFNSASEKSCRRFIEVPRAASKRVEISAQQPQCKGIDYAHCRGSGSTRFWLTTQADFRTVYI